MFPLSFDQDIRGSSLGLCINCVVPLNKKLYSILSLSTQVYKGAPSPGISINNINTFLVPGPTIMGTYVKLSFGSVKQTICRWKWIFGSVIFWLGDGTVPEMIVTVKCWGLGHQQTIK